MKTAMLIFLIIVLPALCISAQSMFDKVNDFDGDGKADYAVTRNENGQKIWYLWRSTAGFGALAWGLPDDVVAAGDYDGDARTDVAVSRLTAGPGDRVVFTTYYLASATGSVGILRVDALNLVGATSVSNEDYDGDGKTDAGVFQWHGFGDFTYTKSSDGSSARVSMSWFQVRTGDVTGSAAAEVVSYNPNSREAVVRNVADGGQTVLNYGLSGDVWVAADFDGDNKGDYAIFRPSSGDWWWIRSSDSVVNSVHWGLNGDVPVPADYDGDGKSDLAVYRPGSPQSIFYVYGSSTGYSAFGFGIATDTVVKY